MTPCACVLFHFTTHRACQCDCHAESDNLTPEERSDLRLIADRARLDGADMAPMLWDGKVIPWLEALNLDPALGL